MNGYVVNISTMHMHVMKRSVRPGQKIPLADLYKQYGKKHDIAEGEDFIGWLKAVKLKDTTKWGVVLADEVSEVKKDKVAEIEDVPKSVSDHVAPPVTVKMEVRDVVMLSVRKAREVLPTITDLKLLKYAFQEANQLAGKDSLCNIMRKRIKDLELRR